MDWLQWHPERLTDPVIWIGIVCMVLGLGIALCARTIGTSIARRFPQERQETVGMQATIAAWAVGGVIIVVGALVAMLA